MSMHKYRLRCTCGAELLIEERQVGIKGKCIECGKLLVANPESLVPLDDAGKSESETALGRQVGPDGVSVEWQVGDVILNLYEIVSVLGEGGMGRVYKAYHRGWNTPLAVKSPRPKVLLREKGTANFEQECETWINLGLHPNIVSCYYVRRIGGIPRVFAEFVDGESMWHAIQDGRLYRGGPRRTVARIINYGIQMAWGLHHAHEHGLVHQDVKSANILISQEGVAKVTDFGLARAVADENSVDFVGMTRAYSSPEQAQREKMTHKTDIWSWAVCMLEAFTVKVVWKRGQEAPEILKHYLAQSKSNPSLLAMPERLARVLTACFQINPDQRPNDLVQIANELIIIYREVTGHDFARKRPRPTEALADNLNNRAVSLTDIGRIPAAEAAWEQALKSDPHHPESTYNLGLVRWRSGRLSDDAFIQRLHEVQKFHPGEWLSGYLIGQVQLERGDFKAATRLLKAIPPPENARREVVTGLTAADTHRGSSREFLHSFGGHNDVVTCVVCSPDGRFVMTGSADNTLKLWTADSGRCVRTFEGHHNSVASIAVTQDDRFAISGSYDRCIRMWDIARGVSVVELQGHRDAVRGIAIDARGRRIVSASLDTSVRVWDVVEGSCLATMEGHRGGVLSVVRHPEEPIAFSGSYDRNIIRWDLDVARSIATYEGHTDAVEALALSPDGRLLASASDDLTIRLWDWDAGECVRVMEGHQKSVNAIDFTPSGSHLVSSSRDGTVRLWEVASGRCLFTFDAGEDDVRDVSVTGDSERVFSVGNDKLINVWSIGALASTVVAPPILCKARSSEDAITLGQAFDQSLGHAKQALERADAVTASRQLREARSHSGYHRSPEAMQAWRQLYVRLPRIGFNSAWEQTALPTLESPLKDLRISLSGRYALTLTGSNCVRVWDISKPECIVTFEQDPASIESICMTDDGQRVLTGGWEIKLWDMRSGTCLRSFERQADMVASLDLSPDGAFALSAAGKTIKVWDVSTGMMLREMAGHTGEVSVVRWSADGSYAVSGGSDRHLCIWDVSAGSCVGILDGHTQPITTLDLSVDGPLAVSGSGALLGKPGELRVWNLATGTCIHELTGHTDRISTVHITADSHFAASAGQDRTVRLWDLRNGKLVHTIEGLPESVEALRITLDGSYLVYGTKDGDVRIWALDWRLEERPAAAWDDAALPHLRRFLSLFTPYSGHLPSDRYPKEKEIAAALKRRGKAQWAESDLQRLFYILGCAGCGWLDPNGVIATLNQVGQTWRGPQGAPDYHASGGGLMGRLFGHRHTE